MLAFFIPILTGLLDELGAVELLKLERGVSKVHGALRPSDLAV